MLDTWTTLRYRDGYTDKLRHGASRIELTLAVDRHARVAYFTEASVTPVVREGELAEWVLLELFSNLRAMNFPKLAEQASSPGDWMALLSVAVPTGTHQAWILPGHRQVAVIDKTVLLLEAVASALIDEPRSAYKPSPRPALRRGT